MAMLWSVLAVATLLALAQVSAHEDSWDEQSLTEGDLPVLIMKRNSVTYTNRKFSNMVTDAVCTQPQLGQIENGIKTASPYISKGITKSNPALFKKWFGSPTTLEPDRDVINRMNEAFTKLKSRDYKNHCCPTSGPNTGFCKQACGHSADGKTTLAFVVSGTGSSGDENQYNGIFWCARTFSEFSAIQFGFVGFHEVIHMVSRAGDGAKDYSKASIVGQAKNDPNTARITAQSYTLYAMQNGLSVDQYEKASSAWGGSVSNDGSCKDQYTNCYELAKTSKCDARLKGQCCSACMKLQPPGTAEKCYRDKYSNCNQHATSVQKCQAGTVGSKGEMIGIACCKTCENMGVKPDDEGTKTATKPVARADTDTNCPNYISKYKCSACCFSGQQSVAQRCPVGCASSMLQLNEIVGRLTRNSTAPQHSIARGVRMT